MFEDVVYYFTLSISITLACYYKRIDKADVKRNYGTGIGVLITFMICGRHTYHTVLMVWSNIIIQKYCNKRNVHQVSLVYTWLHLIFLHISIINAQYVLWIHQNIALRLVGMAFEIHSSDRTNRAASSAKILSFRDVENIMEPTTFDVISYAFFFIGLHKGPYYRYQIFKDHFSNPFANLGDFRIITEHKLKKVFVCLIGYSLLRMKFSNQVYSDSSFYNYDAEKRYLYNIPMLLMYSLNNVIIMLLATCACTEAGFGVYPTRTMPVPGHGPTMRHSLLNISPEFALKQEYNFSMLKCYDYEKLLIGPRMKETLRSWDMPIQYWFWMNIYKNMFKASKEIRSACSSLAFTLWSGPSLQQLIISATLWVYVHLESEYSQLYDTSTRGQMKLPWDIGFSIMRMFCLIYLTPCLIISDAATTLRYYNSICWVFHGVLFALMVGAVVTLKLV